MSISMDKLPFQLDLETRGVEFTGYVMGCVATGQNTWGGEAANFRNRPFAYVRVLRSGFGRKGKTGTVVRLTSGQGLTPV